MPDKRLLIASGLAGLVAGRGFDTHLAFTNDLRSAFAVHAPVPELCRDGLLTRKACLAGVHRRAM